MYRKNKNNIFENNFWKKEDLFWDHKFSGDAMYLFGSQWITHNSKEHQSTPFVIRLFIRSQLIKQAVAIHCYNWFIVNAYSFRCLGGWVRVFKHLGVDQLQFEWWQQLHDGTRQEAGHERWSQHSHCPGCQVELDMLYV